MQTFIEPSIPLLETAANTLLNPLRNILKNFEQERDAFSVNAKSLFLELLKENKAIPSFISEQFKTAFQECFAIHKLPANLDTAIDNHLIIGLEKVGTLYQSKNTDPSELHKKLHVVLVLYRSMLVNISHLSGILSKIDEHIVSYKAPENYQIFYDQVASCYQRILNDEQKFWLIKDGHECFEVEKSKLLLNLQEFEMLIHATYINYPSQSKIIGTSFTMPMTYSRIQQLIEPLKKLSKKELLQKNLEELQKGYKKIIDFQMALLFKAEGICARSIQEKRYDEYRSQLSTAIKKEGEASVLVLNSVFSGPGTTVDPVVQLYRAYSQKSYPY